MAHWQRVQIGWIVVTDIDPRPMLSGKMTYNEYRERVKADFNILACPVCGEPPIEPKREYPDGSVAYFHERNKYSPNIINKVCIVEPRVRKDIDRETEDIEAIEKELGREEKVS
jgi:hypothetical protein